MDARSFLSQPWRRYGGDVTTAITAIPAVDVPVHQQESWGERDRT